MNTIIIFIQKAIGQGICMMYGANGEILTEKSGNLNLGVPGLMYIGGIAGLAGAYFYENGVASPIPVVGFLISLLCAILAAALGGFIYSLLTVTLRANQNVTGLALTTFGVGLGNFYGGSISKMSGGVGQISVATTAGVYKNLFPHLSTLPVVGPIFFSYGFLTYFCVIVAIVMHWFLNKTRQGLCLRAVGENPATADAAGVNVDLYT